MKTHEKRRYPISGAAALAMGLLLASCGWSDNARYLSRHYGGGSTPSATQVPGDLSSVARSVAMSRQSQEQAVQGEIVRGIYLGQTGAGCQNVGIVALEGPEAKRKALRARNYEVCGGAVREVGANTLAPSYPDDAEARTVLDRARYQALLYGTQLAQYQSYSISARRLGVPSARPCQPVETTVTHDNMLVFHSLKEVCQ